MPCDFPGGPVVKTAPSSVRGSGSIPGQGAEIPRASWPKHQKKLKKKMPMNAVTSAVKALKNGPYPKNLFKNTMLAVNHRYISQQPCTWPRLRPSCLHTAERQLWGFSLPHPLLVICTLSRHSASSKHLQYIQFFSVSTVTALDQTPVSCAAGRSFPIWARGKRWFSPSLGYFPFQPGRLPSNCFLVFSRCLHFTQQPIQTFVKDWI